MRPGRTPSASATLPPATCARAACAPPWSYRGLAGHCIAIQSSLALLSCHNTVRLYCDTNSPLLYNTTPPSLQYTFQPTPCCNTIQHLFISQYNVFSCNIIWAVAQLKSAPFFFRFFIIIYLFIFSILFPIISNSWKNH